MEVIMNHRKGFAMAKPEEELAVTKKLFQGVIDQEVAERLDSSGRGFNRLTDDMNQAQIELAQDTAMDMLENACLAYLQKKRERMEERRKKGS